MVLNVSAAILGWQFTCHGGWYLAEIISRPMAWPGKQYQSVMESMGQKKRIASHSWN
jgi:hypothetical protein